MPQPKVTIYSTPTCPYCVTLKAYLDKHNIKYGGIDVSRDKEAAERMVEKSGQRGVPVVEIGDEVIVGFDKEKISRLLDIKE